MKKHILIFFSLILAGETQAQSDPLLRKSFKVRGSFSPVLSFYRTHPQYTINIKPKMAYVFSLQGEFCFTRQVSLLTGAEWMRHGLGFDSYYFAPGHSVIFDKKFNYHHTLFLHELHFPLLCRIGAGTETRDPFTAYIIGGWSYRLFVSSYAVIESLEKGGYLYDDFTRTENEYSLFTDRGASMLQIGSGFQRNNRIKSRSVFLEAMLRIPLSHYRYHGNGTSNNFLIKDYNLSIGVGFRI